MQDCEIEKIETRIENASDFDAYHEIFSQTITRIRAENPNAEILLNISSATPQIKTAMCLEVVTHHVLLSPIQVSSPNEGTNKDTPHFDPYKDDIDDALKNLMDSMEEAPDRCSPPKFIGMRKSMVKNQIKSLTASWGYKGAYDLVRENAPLFTERLQLLLHHAYLRSLPDEKKAESVVKKLDVYYELYPVRTRDAKNVCEYILAASLRLRRQELTDFLLRVITLAEYMLEIEVDRALGGIHTIADETRNGGWLLNHEKAEKNYPGITQYLESFKFVTLAAFEFILKYLKTRGIEITGYEKIFVIRGKRNNTAHRLQSVTEADFEAEKTTSNELLRGLQAQAVSIFGKEIDRSVFKVFENLNRMIGEELDKVAQGDS